MLSRRQKAATVAAFILFCALFPNESFAQRARFDTNRTTLHLENIRVPSPSRDKESSAQAFLLSHPPATKHIPAGFVPRATGTIRHGSQSIHMFDFTLDGLPVFFQGAAVQLDDNYLIRRARITSRRPTSPHQPHPSRDGAVAADWANMHDLEPSIITPGWLPDENGRLRPAARLDITPTDGEHYTVYLDVEHGTTLRYEPMTWHQDPLGRLYDDNPLTTPDPSDLPLLFLDAPGDKLHGAYARVNLCSDPETCEEGVPDALPDQDGNFLFNPILQEGQSDTGFAQVNAYRNISSINDWVRREFGWDRTFHEETWIEVRVGRNWHNAAFYSGNDEIPPKIVFGRDDVDFAYDKDVAYHEFGHAINRSLRSHPWFLRDQYGMDLSPFGIEEGFADIWAQTYSGDPVMNSYITASRTADNDLVCPDDVLAEGHMEARIVSGFAWDAREQVGAHVWNNTVYRSLLFLASTANYADMVQALATSVADLHEEGFEGAQKWHDQVITKAAEARGFTSDECSQRLVPLYDGEPARVFGYGNERTNKRDFPTGLQWKITADDDTKAFRLYMEWRYPEEDETEIGYRVHVRRNLPVAITWLDPENVPESEPEFTATADLTVEGSPSYVDFPTLGRDPLEPGDKVYVLVSADTPERIFVVDVEPYFLSSQPPDFSDGGLLETTAKAFASPRGCTASETQWTPTSSPSFIRLISALL